MLRAIKEYFTLKKIKVIVKEINNVLNEDNKDIDQAKKHLQKSIAETENAINNIMAAIQQGKESNVIPLLLGQLEKLQEEKQALKIELEELDKERPKAEKIDEYTILSKVHNLESVLSASDASNKEKRMAVRYFIRQLQFNPDTGELYVYFWHDPMGHDVKRLKLLKNKIGQNKKEDVESSSLDNISENIMISSGAGNRNRTGTIFWDRRILSPVRLPVPPSRPVIYLEAAPRFELGNKGFADLCLTTWLCRLEDKWSGRRDLNPRPSPWQGDALPLSHFRIPNGALGRNRTTDTRIFSPLLYRLSYQGEYYGDPDGT